MVQQFAFSKQISMILTTKRHLSIQLDPRLRHFETILSSQNLHNLSDISYCDDPHKFQIAMDNHISDRLKKAEKLKIFSRLITHC